MRPHSTSADRMGAAHDSISSPYTLERTGSERTRRNTSAATRMKSGGDPGVVRLNLEGTALSSLRVMWLVVVK